MIPFNIAPVIGSEQEKIVEVLKSSKLSGDGYFNQQCQKWFRDHCEIEFAALTPSCTAALEMSAILIDILPGDEVIMPSYTFVSTANAFVLRGAKIIFVDIRPDTMNIDETKIEAAISVRTKAIVPVHYAGVACEMDYIMSIAEKYKLWVIEDAAQGVKSTYKGKALGTIGHIGCYSFHDTKNYSAGGEGGAILVREESLIERAEIIREKGTDRSRFFKGQIDKYTWQDIGSSFLLSDLQAAFLFAQLESSELINDHRLMLWNQYYQLLLPLAEKGVITLPTVPAEAKHNAHMFYLKLSGIKERTALSEYLKQQKIISVFHYVPLHSSPAGIRFGLFVGEDSFTTSESKKLLRLPLFYALTKSEVLQVVDAINKFFNDN